MDRMRLLTESRTTIISEALHALTRATLPHYEASHAEQNSERLSKLFDLTLQGVGTRTLIPIVEYARGVAALRRRIRTAGGSRGVQRAGRGDLADDRGETPTSAVPGGFRTREHGARRWKAGAALEWVSLAGHHHAAKSLDLSAMFR